MKKLSRTKLIIIIEAAVALLIIAAVVIMSCFVTVEGNLYPRTKKTLDLTEKTLTAAEYEQLQEKLPQAKILWTIPLAGGPVRSDATELTLTSLSQEELDMLDHMTRLQIVYAEECGEAALLGQLQQRHPQAEVRFSVLLGGRTYSPDAQSASVSCLTEADLPALTAFRNLTKLTVTGGTELALVDRIRQEHPQWEVEYAVPLGSAVYPGDTRELTLENESYDVIEAAVTMLPELERLELINPGATAQQLTDLRQNNPQLSLQWRVEAYGLVFEEDTVEMDFTDVPFESLEEVAGYADAMPKLEKLVLGECGIDNEQIAALRESRRESYKVVWTVRFTPKFAARTDSTTIMPGHKDIGEYRFNESMGVNVQDLKYFEDVICMDLGHFNIYKADFLAYMPKLQFLILSWTEIHDLSPIVNCQDLIYLELDYSQVRDFTPLVELKNLQDLNVCGTVADVTPLTQMTWLDNLWAADRGYSAKQTLLEAFPQEEELDEEGNVLVAKSDTYLYIYGGSTRAWRHLPHYYEMRDMLGMHYMDQ